MTVGVSGSQRVSLPQPPDLHRARGLPDLPRGPHAVNSPYQTRDWERPACRRACRPGPQAGRPPTRGPGHSETPAQEGVGSLRRGGEG